MTLLQSTYSIAPPEHFYHDDYDIIIDSEASVKSGASNRCYRVLVKHKNSDEERIPRILKEFRPTTNSGEPYPAIYDGQQLHFRFSDTAADQALKQSFLKRRTFVEQAYALQKKLSGINQTMGIIVHPITSWSDDSLSYYTLHEANWGKSLEQDPPTDLRDILRVMHSAADSVARMNAQGYVHGDLKPENLLWLDRGTASSHVALFDFDCSFQYINGDYSNIPTRGTDQYTAPELRNKRMRSPFEMAGIYLPTLDVYSLGIILFHLLFHRFPTAEEENSATEQTIYQVLSQKLEHDPTWRAKLLSEQQKQLAKIIWRSIRSERNPRKSNARYSFPADLAAALGSLLDNLGIRQLPKDTVSRASYTMLSAEIIDKYPLYHYKKSDTMDVVLAGISPMRDAFLEHLISACQMLDTTLRVHIISPHVNDYLEQLLQTRPALGKIVSIWLNGSSYTGERYAPNDASIVEQKLAELYCYDAPITAESIQACLQNQEADYYLLVDADTDRNYQTARALAEQRKSRAFIGYTDGRGDGFGLRNLPFSDTAPIGCNERFSVSEKSFQTDIVERAFQVHKHYADKNADESHLRKEFLETDRYNKSSSIRAALSLAYEAASIGINLKQAEGAAAFQTRIEKRGEDYNKLLWLEHRAWCGYMVMQGYTQPTREQIRAYAFRNGNDQKNKRAKLHPCLCPSRANGLELTSLSHADWEREETEAAFDPLDRFSLFFHRLCAQKKQDAQIQPLLTAMAAYAKSKQEKVFLREVQTACDAMQHGENQAWNALQKPVFQSNTLASLFHALKEETSFLREYNRYHDFKQSDEDILNAAPAIFDNA